MALELLYVISVLKHLGHEFDEDVEATTSDPDAHRMIHRAFEMTGAFRHGPVECGTDNKGAHDACQRDTVTPMARHVERKVLKMRELRMAGKVKVILVPTAENAADILTKAVDNNTFERHRATIMNLHAAAGKRA